MQYLKTENCIICGKEAVCWHGHVTAKEKMALGNYIDKKIIAGFCDAHKETYLNNDEGYYGNYNSEVMGNAVPLFDKK